MRFVRHNADALLIDPIRIGMLGFSAGGHLASNVGTPFSVGDPTHKDPIERFSSRPNFLALIYPAISGELFKKEVDYPSTQWGQRRARSTGNTQRHRHFGSGQDSATGQQFALRRRRKRRMAAKISDRPRPRTRKLGNFNSHRRRYRNFGENLLLDFLSRNARFCHN